MMIEKKEIIILAVYFFKDYSELTISYMFLLK